MWEFPKIRGTFFCPYTKDPAIRVPYFWKLARLVVRRFSHGGSLEVHLLNPKGSCAQIVYTLGPMYLYREYFKANVYTIWVHGPLR